MNSSLRQMPPHWDDDERMTVMFAPFRIKTLNPVGWESKMQFWTDAIRQFCDQVKSPVFTLNDLIIAFVRKNKSPNCLETVVQHLNEEKIIVPRSQVFHRDGWLSWGTKQLLKPVTWATKSVIPNIVLPKSKDQQSSTFVHLESLKKLSISFATSIPQDCCIGTFSTLKASSSLKDSITDDVLQLLLDYLVFEKLAIVSDNNQIYKLTSNTNVKVTPITVSEISLFQISQTICKLNESIADLESKIDTALLNAKQHLRKGNKTAARNQLKQKKSYELRLEKIENNHNTLSNLSENIKQTHMDAEVFDVFKSSLSTLKTTMKDNNLKEDLVLDTMDDLKDALDEISNIQTAIAQPIGLQVDDDELELELQKLTQDNNLDNDGGTVSFDFLPSAPTDDAIDQVTEAIGKKLAINESI